MVSAFRGKGKKSAWQTWDVFDEVTETCSNVSQFPTEVTDTDLKTLDRFVVLMYDRSSSATGVDEERLHMFARKQRLRKTTVFRLVQYMCSNGQLSNILYRFACGC